MLEISQQLIDQMVAHAKRDHPDEACGVIAGPEGADRPTRFVPMINAAGSPTFYEFDSTELLGLYKQMWANDEEPVVIYHSHTRSEPYPSQTDLNFAAYWPGVPWLIIGVDGEPATMRWYEIEDGAIGERPVRRTEA